MLVWVKQNSMEKTFLHRLQNTFRKKGKKSGTNRIKSTLIFSM